MKNNILNLSQHTILQLCKPSEANKRVIISQQVNADIVIVICNDCSTDNAREVFSQYKEKYPNMRFFYREKNMG